MEIPHEVAVMTLPNATLFPQALLPLHIFEPRYRRMLADALESHRMFIVAMQKPNCVRETPSTIAGLGLIRVAVDNPDGTTHLILQGMTRVKMAETVRYKPYRVQRIRPLQATPSDNVRVDALLAKVRDLVTERIELGFPFPFPLAPKPGKKKHSGSMTLKEIVGYLDKLHDADQVADLVSCALLARAVERQTILETVDVEPRLKHLIHFLMAEIKQHRKDNPQ
ncbi:MAG: LON peptidase substrate-binding domain-containing protein [Verrucomicrobiota bacterium]